MTIYVKYQCSVCKREKTLPQDNTRVTPNSCTITKACSGILQILGNTVTPINQLPVAGLEDWYPDGSRTSSSSSSSSSSSAVSVSVVQLASSAAGTLVLAVKEQDEGSLPTSFDVSFSQRKSENIAFSEYTFKTQSSTNTISGKDSNGKVLRIDSSAISENRIQLRVNGVLNVDFAATTSSIIFTSPISAGSIISIRIQNEKDVTTRVVTFTRNSQLPSSSLRGSWANVDFVRLFNPSVGLETWWLYSVDSFMGNGVGKMQISDLGTSRSCMLLLAHTPFSSFDRYLNFSVSADSLSTDFPIIVDSQSRELTVDRSIVTEIYPPIKLDPDSFIDDDIRVSTTSSVIVTDDVNVIMTGNKVLGPV